MYFSKEERKRRSEWMKSLNRNPKFVRKLNRARSTTMRLLHKNPKFLRKKSIRSRKVMKALHQDSKFQQRMSRISSETMARTNCNPEFKRKLKVRQSHRLKAQWKDPEFRKKMSICASKHISAYNRSPRGRKRARELMLERRLDPNFVRTLEISPSGPELILFNRLKEAGVKSIKSQYFVAPYLLDIAHLETKINIESDGEYFHKHRKAKDRARDAYLRRRGWRIIRVVLNSKREALRFDISKLVYNLARKMP